MVQYAEHKGGTIIIMIAQEAVRKAPCTLSPIKVNEAESDRKVRRMLSRMGRYDISV